MCFNNRDLFSIYSTLYYRILCGIKSFSGHLNLVEICFLHSNIIYAKNMFYPISGLLHVHLK